VFVITEKRLTQELINAKKRGVDVKVIVDALNASTEHSKHKELRSAGIPVKAENYAGKMHSKTMIVDDEFLVVGSMNFSNSGENRNDENVVILKNAEAAKFYKDFFLYQWDKIPEEWLKYTPRAEGKDSIGSCSDGIDNDYDGKIDMEDEACKEALSKKGK
jgi:phosphatidylserine/phosphatidylglycerophosphate/cardiolipin synthase-like enzyme